MDEFVLPESLDGLSATELDALLTAARDEANAIAADVESADLDRLEALASAIETIETAQGVLAIQATERAEKLAALSARINPVAEAEAEVDEAEVVAETSADEAVIAEAEAVVEAAATAEPVVAAVTEIVKPASLPKPTSKQVAALAKKPAPTAKAGVAIVAAAGAPGVRNGHQFADLLEAVPQVLKLWSGYQGAGVSYAKDNVFNLKAPARDPRMVANGHNDQDVVNYATDETRLVPMPGAPEGATPLVAAGGWCAPPEQKYDICTLADLDGIWDVPTIGMPRGSISYFRQLDYSTVAAAIAAGQFCFTDAELTVDPPVVKPCFEIPCATPVEATLDACGLCLRAGLLQQKAFPELIAAWLHLALIAHAHFLNARNLTQAQALMPAPVALAATFGSISALLSAIDLAATDVRAFNGMSAGRSLDVVFPYWVPALLRSDYVRRQFTDGSEYTVAEWNAALGARGVRPQYVKDMPGMDGGFGGPVPATVWPATVEFWIYPAGAFLRGSEDIISVSTLVDSALLQTNRVQLLFIEAATVILPACGDGRRYTVPVCPSGETAGPVDPVGAGICPTP